MEEPDIEEMNATEYKSYHESLMQNNHGSSAFHVFFCIFFTVQCTIYSSVKIKNLDYQQIYEYMMIVMPLILVHTVLSQYLYLLNFIIFTMLVWEVKRNKSLAHIKKIEPEKSYDHNRIQSISVMRGLTYLITVLCILAVDFKCFPRELAKTERYGHSLMDTGVGLFVLMSGIVHKDLKNDWRNVFLGNMKFILVLAALGVVRYASVKQLDYQEHVSEYGVHWNFFFTLAVCKILSTFLLHITSESCLSTNTIVQSFILLAIHELILACGVQEWAFGDTPRDSILSANREGISSCLGYVAMYLFSSHLKDELKNNSVKKLYYNGLRISIHSTVLKLFAGSIILWLLSFLCNYIRPASRTLANAGYCIYVESILITVMLVLYFSEKYFGNEKSGFEMPKIINNVNSNGLLYFLIANLLTGAVNLSMRTLLVSNSTTFVILNTYMIVALSLPIIVKNALSLFKRQF